MDVLGHDRETRAGSHVGGQFGRQQANHDLTRPSVIQQAATSVTRKRDELRVQLVIVDTSSGHGRIVARTHEQYNPLVAMQHGHICRKSVLTGNVLRGKVSVPPALSYDGGLAAHKCTRAALEHRRPLGLVVFRRWWILSNIWRVRPKTGNEPCPAVCVASNALLRHTRYDGMGRRIVERTAYSEGNRQDTYHRASILFWGSADGHTNVDGFHAR